MLVKLSNGKALRVQFVHASHNGLQLQEPTPGGLRQLVDNLALSLDRRLTLCEISEVVEGEFLTSDPDSKTPRTYKPLAQGVALCYKKDQFKKLVGRSIALYRAVTALQKRGALQASGYVDGEDYLVEQEIWDKFPVEADYIADHGTALRLF